MTGTPLWPPPRERTAWEWVQAGFWLAIGLILGSLAFTLAVVGILLGLGLITATDLRPQAINVLQEQSILLYQC